MPRHTTNIRKPARPQMEVYTSAHASTWMYNALPSPLTSFYGLVMAGSVTGLAYYIGDKWFNNGMMWSITAISIMTVIGMIGMGLKARSARKEAAHQGEGFEEALRESSSGWDDSISDPAEIARQDELRKKFLKGIQVFKDHERDLYSLPWYVMVGPPGSGKTEAVRHSELRFPEHLHDSLLGTGGTYSMDWWFTSQAIIIDTAGAMLMQAEASARFEEFLKLLRTHRPACPINGLILTIPTDRLMKDPPQVAHEEARRIASQLALIQKALDVRFPIYLMISKSDCLPCWREYFNMDGQARYERQMMGWANPAHLGEPFSPDSIYLALDTIARRVHARGLALLADPVPVTPDTRRADEVDAVYSLPHFLRGLAPRLKLYLDVIFQTGVWAAKPPFFRGIFFTSAMQEGAQLDSDLAKALGLPMQQLPGGVFRRDKSVFLRDFFLEKIFPEKGLVTKLFDVGAHLRRKLTTFYSATAALLALALGFSWLVKERIETRLSDDQTMWASANSTWQNGSFLRVIGRSSEWSEAIPDRPRWYLARREAQRGKPADPIRELEEIHARVNEKIGLSWVFQPVPEWRDFLERRKQGYLTLFEGSIMKPVLDAARERILWDVAPGNTTSADTQQRLATAYMRLVELETWLEAGGKSPAVEDWRRWFLTLLLYITDPAPPGGLPETPFDENPLATAPQPPENTVLDRLAKDMAARAAEVYGKEVDLATRQWMRDPDVQAASALRLGADFIFGKTRSLAASTDQSRREAGEALRAAANSVLRAEQHLLDMATQRPQGPRAFIEMEGMRPFQEAVFEFQKIADTHSKNSNVSRLGMETVADVAARILEAERSLKDPADGLRHAVSLARRIKASAGPAGQDGPEMDAEDIWVRASRRHAAYQEAFKPLRTRDLGIALGNSVGNLSQKLQEVTEHVQSVGRQADAVPEESGESSRNTEAEKQSAICEYLQKFRGTPLISEVFRNYEQELRTLLQQKLLFPLVQRVEHYDKMYSFETACKDLARVETDMQALPKHSAPLYQCPERGPVEELFRKLEIVSGIKTAISTGLFIEVDAVEPARILSKQTEAPDLPPPGSGDFAPPSRTSVTESIQEGFINIRITIDGSKKVDGPPNGESKRVPYDGLGSVRIALTFARLPPQSNHITEYSSPQGSWPLLREIARSGRNRFAIGSSGKIFVLQSTPSLPVGHWPDIKDFMPR